MSRIEEVFLRRNAPAFIGFTVAGDPDPETSRVVVKALIDAGIDMLELGIPFSDPIADGPAIQRAHDRALHAGSHIESVFAQVRTIREYSDIPIVLFSYYNLIYRRGMDRFVREAREAGADGLLAVDLPYEESSPLGAAAESQGMDLISLVAPTTTPGRRRAIVTRGSGFVYLVAVEGVTGVREHLPDHLAGLVASLRQETDLPLAVGFGVSSPEHMRAIAGIGVDAAIVGSAIVGIIEEHLEDRTALPQALRTFVAGMIAAGSSSRP
jgi:tryptophan synthase alpha chain